MCRGLGFGVLGFRDFWVSGFVSGGDSRMHCGEGQGSYLGLKIKDTGLTRWNRALGFRA